MRRARAAAVVVVLVLMAGAALSAHALDEYVQATRVDVTPAGVRLFVDLTPGVAIAQTIVDRLDSDGDGAFSPGEAEIYGRALVADLELSVDGATLPLSLVRVEVPTAGVIRDGQGAIRIEARADAPLPDGRHRLILRNSHRPAISVYLANALVPDSPDIHLVKQARDTRQQTYWLDFDSGRPGQTDRVDLAWLLAGATVLASLIRLRNAGN